MSRPALHSLGAIAHLLGRLRNTNGFPPSFHALELEQAERDLQALRAYFERRSLAWWDWRRYFGPWPVVLLLVALLGSGCTAHKTALRALSAEGYSEVKLCGSAWWCCGDKPFGDCFSAKAPSGEVVNGCVCSGWFGGSSVRLK